MSALKGSRTETNLLTAFAGESQARNRYEFFAKQARKDGYILLEHIFLETAGHEKEHAKRIFKFLEGGEATITAAFPAGVIAATLDNLKSAAAGELHETEVMYPEYAQIAREEGFKDIAFALDHIARAERYHYNRYTAFIRALETGSLFKRDVKVTWRCRNCGYLHEGHVGAPEKCPACDHPQAYFEVLTESWQSL
ncbi:MAG: rubrerythrin family protein [Desulfovibrionaceae bacterium]|jgi:rubrerythrin|nr:rubrerythrin family protein [Desulfovibrionaceae bacterium]